MTSSYRFLSQTGLKIVIALVCVLVGAEPAPAVVFRCESLYLEDLLPKTTPQAAASLQGAMRTYRAIMKIETIGHKKEDIDAVKTKIKAMTEGDRQKLRELIRQQYGNVKAFKYGEDRSFKSFKRHLDVALTELSDASGTIAKEYAKRGNLEDALTAYYGKVQEMTDFPLRIEGEDVLYTALRLRERFFGPDRTPGQGPIVLYGSFPNGRSYPKSSDLDFAVLHAELETRIRESDILPELKEFEFSDAEPHVVSPKQVHALGYLNNVVVLVRVNSIEVRVYRSHLSGDFRQARSTFDVYYL